MNLRGVTLTDPPKTVKIHNSTVPARMLNADTETVSVESRLAWFHEHYPKGHPIWIAEEGARSLAG